MIEMKDLLRLVELQLGRPLVSPEQRFAEDLAAESIDMMHIVVNVEETCGIYIPEEKIPDLKTVSDLHRYIAENWPK